MTRDNRQSGFMLLEMVIAVGLLVLGMALIGAQISTSSDIARETDRLARVVFLAESKIAELDTGLILPEEEIEEDFGRLFPEFGWRMRIVPASESDLNMITLEILHQFGREVDEEFDFTSAEVVQTYYTLRATPKPLDLTQDFGLEEEQADNINEQLAELTGGAVDVREFDPSVFQNLSTEELAGLAQLMLGEMGGDASALMQLIPPQARDMLAPFLQELEDALGTGGDSDSGGDTNAGDSGGANPADQNGGANNPSSGANQPAGTGGDSGSNNSAQDGGDTDRPTRGNRNNRGGGRRGNDRGRPARAGTPGGGR